MPTWLSGSSVNQVIFDECINYIPTDLTNSVKICLCYSLLRFFLFVPHSLPFVLLSPLPANPSSIFSDANSSTGRTASQSARDQKQQYYRHDNPV
jgi:hypothetical protein